MILFTAIGSLGIRLAGQFLQVMFWVPAVLTLYIIYLLATTVANPSALATGITMLGTAQGFSGRPTTIRLTLPSHVAQYVPDGAVGGSEVLWSLSENEPLRYAMER